VVVEQRPLVSNLLKRHLQGIPIMHVRSSEELGQRYADSAEAILLNEPIDSDRIASPSLGLLQRLPVLRCYVTGFVEGGQAVNLPSNVRRFLVKPIVREQLFEVIDEILQAANSMDHATGGQKMPVRPAQFLVVEDDEDALRLLGRILRSAPPSVCGAFAEIIPVEARSVEQALDYLLEQEEPPIDAVLLDIGLGAASGFDLLREMARHEHLRHIPTCIVSGREMRPETLISPYLIVEKEEGLTGRELTQSIAALLRIMLPGVDVAAQ